DAGLQFHLVDVRDPTFIELTTAYVDEPGCGHLTPQRLLVVHPFVVMKVEELFVDANRNPASAGYRIGESEDKHERIGIGDRRVLWKKAVHVRLHALALILPDKELQVGNDDATHPSRRQDPA